MNKPTLIIMAAGMGSRYGGLKQIDPVGPSGEKIIDYSVYDAIKAGFKKVVFVIEKEMEQIFRESIGINVERIIDTSYVFQELSNLPEGFRVSEGRIKPWGTGHAVLSTRHVVDSPFAVINADDFYGRASFDAMCRFLQSAKDSSYYEYSMIGFQLKNTITENGHVSRGICKVDGAGYLSEIHERTRIERRGGVVAYTEDNETWIEIPEDSVTSMNMWGFTPSIFHELEIMFEDFLNRNSENNIKGEFFLPTAVGKLITEGKARVTVLKSDERWYGVTYKEDKPMVKKAIENMVEKGIYPEKLW